MIVQIIYFLLNLLAVLCFFLLIFNLAATVLMKDFKSKMEALGFTRKDAINSNLFLFCLAMVCILIANLIK